MSLKIAQIALDINTGCVVYYIGVLCLSLGSLTKYPI